MPYITEKRKHELEDPRKRFVSAGDLTYVLYRNALKNSTLDVDRASELAEIEEEVERYLPPHPRYEDFAVVLGCIDSTVRELRRRYNSGHEWQIEALLDYADEFYEGTVGPYEDKKIEENGDVNA